MSLQGVRAYDPEEPQRIEFFKPLTIIVGANGSGKTSVLEALRYISGGQEPPQANRGKNFVHDPVVAGTSSVKAKVMLAFKTVGDLKVLASRVMQVTKQKTKTTFKLIDNAVSITDKNGEKRELTNKCGDMAKLVPGLLGASKALLDNVIFCHQEESNWPLSEDRVLKQKFDDLLSASGHSKIIQQLKTLKSEKQKEQRDLKHKLEILATALGQSREFSEELRGISGRIDEYVRKGKQVGEKLEETRAKIEKYQHALRIAERASQQKELDETRLQLLIDELERTKLNLVPLNGSLEVLSNELQQMEALDKAEWSSKSLLDCIEKEKNKKIDLEESMHGFLETIAKTKMLESEVNRLKASLERLNPEELGQKYRQAKKEYLKCEKEFSLVSADFESKQEKIKMDLHAQQYQLKNDGDKLKQYKEMLADTVAQLKKQNATEIASEIDFYQKQVKILEHQLQPEDDSQYLKNLKEIEKLKTEVGSSTFRRINSLSIEIQELEQYSTLSVSGTLEEEASALRTCEINRLKLQNAIQALDESVDSIPSHDPNSLTIENLKIKIRTLQCSIAATSVSAEFRDYLRKSAELENVCIACDRQLDTNELNHMLCNSSILVGGSSSDQSASELKKLKEQLLYEESVIKRDHMTAEMHKLDNTITLTREKVSVLEKQKQLMQAREELSELEQDKENSQLAFSRLSQLETENIQLLEEKMVRSKSNQIIRKQIIEFEQRLDRHIESEKQSIELQTRVGNLETNIKHYSTLVESVSAKVNVLTTDLKKVKEEYENFKSTSRNKLEEIEIELRSKRELYHEAKTLKERISMHEMELGQQNSASIECEMSEAKLRMRQCERRMIDLEAEYNNSKQHFVEREGKILRLRQNVLVLQLHKQIEEVNERLAYISSKAPKESPERIKDALSTLSEHETKCIRLKSQLEGKCSAETERATSIRQSLMDNRFLDIDERFRKTCIELETITSALKDLSIFYKSLDQALIAFHGRKLEEVNQVLKRLWQTVYKGKDIEYIAICSEHLCSERKQYDYKVIMGCDGRELEMRGRCSAGQRVLACILIRMALSETFCVNCGILALDEPTTNLDAKNIKSLAESLNAIIARRKGQKSFQLVIITHDEDFVSHLKARDHTDFYYTITKDTNGHSKISKQAIHA